MKLRAIFAISDNFVIGKGDYLPWMLQDDLQLFKGKTMGNTIVFGLNTVLGMFNNFPKTIKSFLSGRNIVILCTDVNKSLSKIQNALADKPNLDIANIHLVETRGLYPPQIVDKINQIDNIVVNEIFIAGGAKIFETFIDFIDVFHITYVDAVIEDAPDIVYMNKEKLEEVLSNFTKVDNKYQVEKFAGCNDYDFTYLELSK